MRKLLFALPLLMILSGCGGGGGNTTVAGQLIVSLAQNIGGAQSGETIHIQGGGVSYSCSQSPGQNQPNDTRCIVPTAGNGNSSPTLTFTGLPTGQAYTFTDGSTTGAPRAGSCIITLDSTTKTTPDSPYPCSLDAAGASPLAMTISIN